MRPEGAFGLHLIIGALVLLLCGALFGLIAGGVATQAAFTLTDVQVAGWFARTYWSSPLTPWVLGFTHLHSMPGILMMAAAFAVYLQRKGARYWVLAVLACVPGGMLLNVLLKYTFQRMRPVFDEPLVSLATYSFPSGHAMGATVLYGVLAAYAMCVLPRWPQRALALLLAAAMVLLVSLSRVYLGAHYLSDVVAGMLEGIAWLALCITSISTLRRRREHSGRTT